MKTVFKLFAFFAVIVFAIVVVIKVVMRCSFKEAVGILEEFCEEMKESCPLCNSGISCEEEFYEET